MSFLTNKREINLIHKKQKMYTYKSFIFEINIHKIMKMFHLVFKIIQSVGMDVRNFLLYVWTSHPTQDCFQGIFWSSCILVASRKNVLTESQIGIVFDIINLLLQCVRLLICFIILYANFLHYPFISLDKHHLLIFTSLS